jgi:acyl phosphate:glycerol-3-phosphate acyltransferase
MLVIDVALIACAYSTGCFNAGYYLLRWRDGRDLRELGSGNAGARNAGRVLGRQGFALVFGLDVAKGAIAVLAARLWAPEVAALCAVAVALGHVAPAQLGWRGGKGVATAIGALAALDVAVPGVAAVAFGLSRLAGLRTLPAGALALACAATFALWLRATETGLASGVLAALLVYTHRPRGRT